MTDITDLKTMTADAEVFAADPFTLLRDAADLFASADASDEAEVREVIIQCLEHRDLLSPSMQELIDALVREAGLFPYLRTAAGLTDRDLLLRETLRIQGLADADIVLHTAQANVYARLLAGDNVVLSAPTSFGKSLIIDALLASGRFDNVLVVVPTLALIDEIRRRLATRRTGHKVITHPSQPQGERNVFVFTGERVLDSSLPELDLFVLDEFYKLSDQDERGQILNQVFYEMRQAGVQYYLLGPNVEGLSENVPADLRDEFLRLDEPTVALRFHDVDLGDGREKALVDLCRTLGSEILVYCQSPDSAHRTARMLLSAGIGESEPLLDEAADWVGENFHPDWVIVEALRRGIGVHHGQLPRALGQFIVKAFEDGRIRLLIATGTLIEGVNTHARHMVIYDKRRPGNRAMDQFTYRNISGRCGRMFHHFSGDVWLFIKPPKADLPNVDVPILSQPDEAPLGLLQHVADGDLSDHSRERLDFFADQSYLAEATLRANSGLDLQGQLDIAKSLTEDPGRYYPLLHFDQMPSSKQLAAVCELLWENLGSSGLSSSYTKTHRQLANRLMNFSIKGSTKVLIDEAVAGEGSLDDDALDTLIKEICRFVRSIAGYSFPVRLRALDRIQKDVFGRLSLTPADYSVYAGQVEGLFLESPLVALDEYGVPPELAYKLKAWLQPDGDLDAVLTRLKEIDESDLGLTSFEAELVRYAQEGL
jgi:DEAD/DEAH box helicase/Helicase conserved C-terminal domain